MSIVRAAVIAGLVAVLCACVPDRGDSAETGSSAPEARRGSTAPSERIAFVPEEVTLPGGARAAVRPASTVNGELVVPENVRHVGWWDGSANAGDPYGSTVIAGHVDSATAGIGYFARLLSIREGASVTLRSRTHRLTYRVVSVRSVPVGALATTSAMFDQTGPHRLALITCTGTFRPGRGYDRNLVVIARPASPTQ